MALKLACADFTFPEFEHSETLDLIYRLGFRGVDIGLFPRRTHFQPHDYTTNVEQGAAILANRVKSSGLEVADLFLQSGADLRENAENHPDNRERQKSRALFLRTLEFASSCDAKHITSLPGIHWEDESTDDSFKRSADELAWRVEQAQALETVYSVEPHMWSIAPTPEAALQLVESSPGLTLTLDCSHFVCQGISEERFRPLIAHASHFHARAACRGLLQSSLEKNTIDFSPILGSINRMEYSGWIGIEYVRMQGVAEVAEVDNLSETIRMRELLERQWKETSRKTFCSAAG